MREGPDYHEIDDPAMESAWGPRPPGPTLKKRLRQWMMEVRHQRSVRRAQKLARKMALDETQELPCPPLS